MEDPTLSLPADDSEPITRNQTNVDGAGNQVIDKISDGNVFANVTGNVIIIDNRFGNQPNVSRYKAINQDIEIWKQVYFNAYESVGATANHFVVFDKNNEKQQIPISSLWTMEGQGLIIPNAKFNIAHETTDLELIAIRRMTGYLNTKAYEILHRSADFYIVHEEFGQIVECLYQWAIQDEYLLSCIQSEFPYFIHMCKQYQLEMRNSPKRSYIEFC
jgi:hypothetical protein